MEEKLKQKLKEEVVEKEVKEEMLHYASKSRPLFLSLALTGAVIFLGAILYKEKLDQVDRHKQEIRTCQTDRNNCLTEKRKCQSIDMDRTNYNVGILMEKHEYMRELQLKESLHKKFNKEDVLEKGAESVSLKDGEIFYRNSDGEEIPISVNNINFLENGRTSKIKHESVELSPNKKFVLLVGTDDTGGDIVDIFDIETEENHEIRAWKYFSVEWLLDNKIRVTGKHRIGSPGTVFESADDRVPWVLKPVEPFYLGRTGRQSDELLTFLNRIYGFKFVFPKNSFEKTRDTEDYKSIRLQNYLFEDDKGLLETGEYSLEIKIFDHKKGQRLGKNCQRDLQDAKMLALGKARGYRSIEKSDGNSLDRQVICVNQENSDIYLEIIEGGDGSSVTEGIFSTFETLKK